VLIINNIVFFRKLLFPSPGFFMHANRSKGRIVTNNNVMTYSFGLGGPGKYAYQ